ncbi:hypothetical protein Vretimale_9960 [Volvox reticuliferus]|uniref:Uncharacterized protein n=1 Tax=Volvox reticuliferus TaxID=1737510 RepID=A0A8J4LQV6_9CHLO|nr:hypothetical protein Vretimale_9960 [Volvox reticuliferus]
MISRLARHSIHVNPAGVSHYCGASIPRTRRCSFKAAHRPWISRCKTSLTKQLQNVKIPASNGEVSPEPMSSRIHIIPSVALVSGAPALLSFPLRKASEVACMQANATAALASALLFLLYFCTTLTEHRNAWISLLARTLRPGQDQLLLSCGLTAAAQLATAVWLCLSYPVHSESVLVPLYGAGYASLAVLVSSQRGRRLKGRKKLEIEAGDGERHSLLAQGSRIAARNFTWLIVLMHLTLQAVLPLLLLSTAATGAATVNSLMLPLPFTAMYGVLAVLYGIAGACKFVPDLQG